MCENIKNQHYVWRHYLKPWQTDGRVWCLRHKKIFMRNVEKILKDDYFYRVYKLNNAEEKFIVSIINTMNPTGHEILFKVFQQYKDATSGDDNWLNNYFEQYHSFIENITIPLLENIYKGDISFWSDDKMRAHFSYFVELQYTRTKNIRKNCKDEMIKMKIHPGFPENIRIDNIEMILSLIFTENIANYMHSNSHPYILQNISNKHFLTCDQPVYNLKSANDTFAEEVEIYYPISTNKALLLSSGSVKTICNEEDIDVYNNFMFNIHDEFMLAKRIDELSHYMEIKKNTI